MASPSGLQAVGIIEKDSNDDILWVWSYPTIDSGFRDVLIRKCTLRTNEDEEQKGVGLDYCYGHLSNVWFYLQNKKSKPGGKLEKVVSFCVVIVAKDFNPEKYHHLAGIFSQSYLTTGTPVTIVTHYLSVYTKGEATTPPSSCEEYSEKGYDIRRAYVACPLRDVVKIFGVESILLFNALLLKKKVVVYAPELQTVLDTCRTLPLFVWHRQKWDILFPNMSLEDDELEGLKSMNNYVAGFTDPGIEAHDDLYDVFVNVPAATITVNPDSKDSFGMTKIHKDIAMRLMECVNDEEYSDQAIVKELSTKTKELITNLRKLAGEDGKISLEVLRSRKLTPATENFLYSLASVEGIAEL